MFVGANCSLSMTIGLSRAAAELLIEYGSQEIKDAYVRPMMDGTFSGTMCLTEAHAGTAVGDLHTVAEKRDGTYYVKGQKIFITGGDQDMSTNVIHLVLARCEGAPRGTKGLSLFLAPKFRLDENNQPGEPNDVLCTGIEEKLGIHGSPTCAMSFGDNGDCQGLLIGEEGQGIQIMFHMMNSARIGVGLQSLALGAYAYLSALEYARERVQGVEAENMRDVDAPRVAIVRHPDVKRMLATMKAYVEGGRALLLHSAMCLDLKDATQDASEREHCSNRVELLTPICKAYCSDTAYEVVTMALQTYGGHGYLKDYPIEQLLRDVKIASIYEGTNGVQAMDLLGRKVGRKQGAAFIEFMGDLDAFVNKNAENGAAGPLVEKFKKYKEQLQQVTMNFGMMQMTGDIEYPLLSATPYLRMFGNVVLAWLLIEQAGVAHDALSKTMADSGISPGSDEEQKLVHSDAEAAFYWNKIQTARFFVSNLLPQNDAIMSAIESADRSALETVFEEV
jgi:alkylation response protein AidB-like acyl-CoA dehydrogenase